MNKQTHDRVALEKAAIPLPCVGSFSGISIRNDAMDKDSVTFKKVSPKQNQEGGVVGFLTVGAPVGVNKGGSLVYECFCVCGKTTYVRGSALKGKTTKSCGCKTKEMIASGVKTHSGSYLPEYQVWYQMKQRCGNPKNAGYQRYGGRGIFVCESWRKSFAVFFKDMGGRPNEKSQIDRIDNNDGYYKENCRWVTPAQNALNTRRNKRLTFNGKTQTIKEWADETGFDRNCIVSRLYTLKWSVKDTLTIKPDPSNLYNRENSKIISYQGRSQPLKKWAEEIGIDYKALWYRLNSGWDVDKAFSTPSRIKIKQPGAVIWTTNK